MPFWLQSVPHSADDTRKITGVESMPFFLMTIVFVTNVYRTIMYNMYNLYIYIYICIHDLTHVYKHNMQIHSYIYIYIHSTVTPF